MFEDFPSGIYTPTSGQILFDGKEYKKMNEFVPHMRALIEKPCFFPDLTGFENLQLLSKIQNKIDDKEIINALQIFSTFFSSIFIFPPNDFFHKR